MGLLSKKRESAAPYLVTDKKPPGIDYHDVLDYIQGLTDNDYKQLFKVVAIYRKANDEACKALGIPNKPTTFINKPEAEDELSPYLEHKPKAKKETA